MKPSNLILANYNLHAFKELSPFNNNTNLAELFLAPLNDRLASYGVTILNRSDIIFRYPRVVQ